MNSKHLHFLILFVALLPISSATASHILGHEIFYSIDENGNAELSVVLYRDCYGIEAPEIAIIDAVSNCGDSLTLTANQTLEYGNEVWQFMPFDAYEMVGNCPSNCANSSGRPGVQRFVYSVSVQLPSCNEWRFSQQFCCVSAGVNNLVDGGSNDSRVSTYAFLATNQANSSPRFVASAQNICLNSGEPILQSAYDMDGDSLVYSFCPLFNGWGQNDLMDFVTGASYSQPFVGQSVSLDPATGVIDDALSSQLEYLIGVQVDEYREGVLIGSVQRSSYIQSFNCQTTSSLNTNVVQGTVVNGELQPIAGAEVIVDYSANVSNPENFYIYCTTCEHLENYSWTTNVDIPNGSVTATLAWTPVAFETEVPLHVRLLQATCNSDFSSATMLFSVQQSPVTMIQEFTEATLSVYPNPGNRFFTINSEEGILGYELIDLSGRTLTNSTLDKRPRIIDVELTEPNGTYLLRVFTESGFSQQRVVLVQ
ncbi:MAG: T9SS type A sorting domain-containing protein [Flavobacteriales bacterium]